VLKQLIFTFSGSPTLYLLLAKAQSSIQSAESAIRKTDLSVSSARLILINKALDLVQTSKDKLMKTEVDSFKRNLQMSLERVELQKIAYRNIRHRKNSSMYEMGENLKTYAAQHNNVENEAKMKGDFKGCVTSPEGIIPSNAGDEDVIYIFTILQITDNAEKQVSVINCNSNVYELSLNQL
jgi:hypothetical protein